MLLDELQPAHRVMAQEVRWGPAQQDDLRFVLEGVSGVLADDPALAQGIQELLDDLEAVGQIAPRAEQMAGDPPSPPVAADVVAPEKRVAGPIASAPRLPKPGPEPHPPAPGATAGLLPQTDPAAGATTPRRWLRWALATCAVAVLVAVLFRGSAVRTSPWRLTTRRSASPASRLHTGSRPATSPASGTNPPRRVSCGATRAWRRR